MSKKYAIDVHWDFARSYEVEAESRRIPSGGAAGMATREMEHVACVGASRT